MPNLDAGALGWGDYDGDGALDLLVTTVMGKARLYRNVAPNRGHWLLVRAVDPRFGGRDASSPSALRPVRRHPGEDPR